MPKYGGWEVMEPPLGSGGQGTVFLARCPSRVQRRHAIVEEVLRSNPWRVGMYAEEIPRNFDRFALALWEYARPDEGPELGALKVLKIPEDKAEADEAMGRLKNEVAVLRQGIPGLIKLLGADEQEKWIVTEFMPGGTIEKHPDTFKGNAISALRAFQSLVKTVAALHKEEKVHRDIKPANVFIGQGGQRPW